MVDVFAWELPNGQESALVDVFQASIDGRRAESAYVVPVEYMFAEPEFLSAAEKSFLRINGEAAAQENLLQKYLTTTEELHNDPMWGTNFLNRRKYLRKSS